MNTDNTMNTIITSSTLLLFEQKSKMPISLIRSIEIVEPKFKLFITDIFDHIISTYLHLHKNINVVDAHYIDKLYDMIITTTNEFNISVQLQINTFHIFKLIFISIFNPLNIIFNKLIVKTPPQTEIISYSQLFKLLSIIKYHTLKLYIIIYETYYIKHTFGNIFIHNNNSNDIGHYDFNDAIKKIPSSIANTLKKYLRQCCDIFILFKYEFSNTNLHYVLDLLPLYGITSIIMSTGRFKSAQLYISTFTKVFNDIFDTTSNNISSTSIDYINTLIDPQLSLFQKQSLTIQDMPFISDILYIYTNQISFDHTKTKFIRFVINDIMQLASVNIDLLYLHNTIKHHSDIIDHLKINYTTSFDDIINQISHPNTKTVNAEIATTVNATNPIKPIAEIATTPIVITTINAKVPVPSIAEIAKSIIPPTFVRTPPVVASTVDSTNTDNSLKFTIPKPTPSLVNHDTRPSIPIITPIPISNNANGKFVPTVTNEKLMAYYATTGVDEVKSHKHVSNIALMIPYQNINEILDISQLAIIPNYLKKQNINVYINVIGTNPSLLTVFDMINYEENNINQDDIDDIIRICNLTCEPYQRRLILQLANLKLSQLMSYTDSDNDKLTIKKILHTQHELRRIDPTKRTQIHNDKDEIPLKHRYRL